MADEILFDRRHFIGAAGALLASGVSCAQEPNLPVSADHNILFIAIDDLRPTLGAYGAPVVKSPHIDSLAKRSLLFERAYVHQAICAPSRIHLMTGLRPDTTGIYGLRQPVSDNLPNAITLNGFLKKRGLETVSIGKIYHHAQDDKEGWTRQSVDLMRDPSHKARKKVVSPEAYLTAFEWQEQYPERDRPVPYEAVDVADNAYPDGANTDYAIQELSRLKYQKKRFFLAMGYHKPHLGFNAPKKYWDLYDRDEVPMPTVRVPPIGAPEYSLARSEELRNYGFVEQDKSKPFSDDITRTLNHGYLACVSYVDAQIGRLLKAVKDLELEESTIVVLWSDHGYKLGDYGQFNKHSNYEIDTRIPLIVHVPGMRSAGSRTDALVETVDIFPTLAELSGHPVPDGLEGRSFAPLLANPRKTWKGAVFHQYPRTVFKPKRSLMGYAVRTDDYHYVEWKNTSTNEVEAVELYHNKLDPAETKNLKGQSKYAKIEADMKALLEKGWRHVLPPI